MIRAEGFYSMENRKLPFTWTDTMLYGRGGRFTSTFHREVPIFHVFKAIYDINPLSTATLICGATAAGL